jgi:uncharacterized protein YndB with AHSA1/START domain
MADIQHDFVINAPTATVFEAMTAPAGLDSWWTKQCAGEPVAGCSYELGFGGGYDWRAVVRTVVPGRELEWEITGADEDWTGTRVGFRLEEDDSGTVVRFHHAGWREANGHHRTTCYCWAMYLRLLKRYVEHGEVVRYERRLEV